MEEKMYSIDSITVNNSPKIAVILYCTDDSSLVECIDSIKEQTYKNLTIKVINDTKKELNEELMRLIESDDRFTVITNHEKTSMFALVKESLKEIETDYVSVLKDDCKISVDYFRLMMYSSIEMKSDMVMADVAKYKDSKTMSYYNMEVLRNSEFNDGAMENLINSEGNIIGLTLLYNKLFKTSLLKEVIESSDGTTTVNGQYLLFLLKLFTKTENVSNVHNALCFVKDQFKGIDCEIDKKTEKIYISDCVKMLAEQGYDSDKINNFVVSFYCTTFMFYNCYYEPFIKSLLSETTTLDEKDINLRYTKIVKLFAIKTLLDTQFWFEENIKKFICGDRLEYFGFDMFDTLVVRPFYEPTDLFYLLNRRFNDLISSSSCIDFSIMRKHGEMACRAYYIVQRPCNEDVTLEEIYDFISDKYGISKEITDEMCRQEKALELKYIMPRKKGKEFYELVLFAEKKPFVASDMYLPKEQIVEMLEKCGYDKLYKVYLSNELGISKYSGSLFKYIKSDLRIIDDEIIGFMGDNFEVDVKRSSENGYTSFHLAKPMDLFVNSNKQIYTGEYFEKMFTADGGIIDLNTVLKFVGVRTMLAVVANEMFDNPFISMNRAGDFNADTKFIGRFACGMFLLSEAKWVFDKAKKEKLDTVHFVSRDGYFCKQCFDILKEVCGCATESNYLYLSRKAIVPMYLEQAVNINELYLVPHALKQSPKTIIKILEPILEKQKIEQAERICQEAGFPYERKFETMHQYYCFTKLFEEKFYSKERYDKYISDVKPFFAEQVKEKDVLFDVGYSGRGEKILSSILGYPVSSYYFHTHEPMALVRKERMGFDISTFYSFKPVSAFVTREQIFTPNSPSCIGIDVKDGKCTPIFEKKQESFVGTMLVEQMQNAALGFVKEFIELFSEEPEIMTFNYFDACYPFEYYLHYSKDFDRNIFAFVDFEDDFGMNQTLNIKDYWDTETKNYKCDVRNEPVVITKESVRYEYISSQENQAEELVRNQALIDSVISDMQKSWTWRIGRVIVAIPSFIKRKIFRIE